MPTPYKLASIAAALAKDAAKSPQEATEQAFQLWVSACAEIEMQARAIEQRENEARQQALQHPKNPDEERLLMEDGDKYPVMEWIKAHAEDKRDDFKTFRAFKAAWMKFSPDPRNFPFPHYVYDLRRFLTWRRDQRLSADANSKRSKRQAAKVQKGVKKK